jgi:hypothetical protein
MDFSGRKTGKKPRGEKSPPLVLVYKEAEDIANNQREVQAAFAVLFEETMRRGREVSPKEESTEGVLSTKHY